MKQRSMKDGGAVLPFLALSLFSLLAVAALVLDGGQAYSQRRQMQSAADAAAMAGAAKVDTVKFGTGADASDIYDVVEQIATVNQADSFECELVTFSGAFVADCEDATDDDVDASQGVRVSPSDTANTTFGSIVGISTTTARTVATATIQPLVGARAPLAVCSSGITYDILDEDGKLDPVAAAARGKIALFGAQTYKDKASDPCAAIGGTGGGSGSFKGAVDQDEQDLTIGSELSSDPGTDLPPYETIPCPDTGVESCLILPMVADTLGTGTKASMRVTDWAFWRVTPDGSGATPPTPSGSVKLWGTFVAISTTGPVPPGSIFGDGVVTDPDQIRQVGLIE